MNTTLLCMVLILTAPAPKGPLKKNSSLVGEWSVKTQTYDGRTTAVERNHVCIFLVDGSYGSRADKNGKIFWQRYTSDDSASPPSLDIIASDPSPGEDIIGEFIYKVDGDTLTICLGEKGSGRPRLIDASQGSKNMILTLKRIKPKE